MSRHKNVQMKKSLSAEDEIKKSAVNL